MVAPRETDWTGALLGGRYRLLRCLGRGGMGAVYEATQEDLGRRVAVKVLHDHLARDPDVLARFRREAQAAAALGHPNIVQVTDFQQRAGEPTFLVMEHLVGASLATAIQEGGPLAQTRVAFIARQMLSALAAAHGAGIIHRDLKPDNVFLTSIAGVDDIVKVLDFGVVKLLQAVGPDANLTTTGAAIGTPVYMAPEQARGRGVDARTDLYATGVCMYEALTARLPHDPPSYSALIAAILEEPPRQLRDHRPDVDPAFAAIVHRALEKDPARRFQTAEQMRLALEPFARATVGAGASARPAERAPMSATAVTGVARDDAHAVPTVVGNPPAIEAIAPAASSPQVTLPKTAEQPAMPPTVARDPRGASTPRAQSVQRGTPVTTSRTLAKPSGSARWAWILAAAAIGGGACVGSGLFLASGAWRVGPPPTAGPPQPPAIELAREPASARGAPAPLAFPPPLALPPPPPPPPAIEGPTAVEPAPSIARSARPVVAARPVETPGLVPAPGRSHPSRQIPPSSERGTAAAPQAPVARDTPPSRDPPPPLASISPRPVVDEPRVVDVRIASLDARDVYPDSRYAITVLRPQLHVLVGCLRLGGVEDAELSYDVTFDQQGFAQSARPAQDSRGAVRDLAVDNCATDRLGRVHLFQTVHPGTITVELEPVFSRPQGDGPPAGD